VETGSRTYTASPIVRTSTTVFGCSVRLTSRHLRRLQLAMHCLYSARCKYVHWLCAICYVPRPAYPLIIASSGVLRMEHHRAPQAREFSASELTADTVPAAASCRRFPPPAPRFRGSAPTLPRPPRNLTHAFWRFHTMLLVAQSKSPHCYFNAEALHVECFFAVLVHQHNAFSGMTKGSIRVRRFMEHSRCLREGL
jgi:hypothetical protein